MKSISTLVVFLAPFVSSSFGPVVFPSSSMVIPCSDTPQNCARYHYTIQKADQAALSALINTAASVSASATALNNQIQALMTSSQSLTNLIDPTNAVTDGGQIQTGPTGTQSLLGVTPFMGTLSAQIVEAANSRYTQLNALMSGLQNGLTQIPQILATASESANNELISTSSSILQDITAVSQQMQQYMSTLSSKMISSTNLFNSQLNAAPQATISALNSSLQLENADYTTTSAKLTNFFSQVAALPPTLTSYIQSLISQLSAYQVAQESYGNALVANDTTTFANQVSTAISTLTAQLQGILATSKSSPYYATSLTAYMAGKTSTFSADMLATNRTQQSQINGIISAIQSMNAQISTAFTPISTSINSLVSQFNTSDNQFIADATQYLRDVNTTIGKANTSFVSFATNMNNLWNTTGSILSGQTTAISEDLLTRIGNMTQQAGAEVDNLNAIMLSAGTGALQADAVRQAILANSRSQVFTMIGDNSAALNTSFATITKFLNGSKAELDLITNIVQAISGSQSSNLNQTATAAINGVKTELATIQNTTKSLSANMVKGMNDAIGSTQVTINGLMSALDATANTNLDQAKSLIAMMNAKNVEAFSDFNTQMNAAQNLLVSAIDKTTTLLATVGNIATNASSHGSRLTSALNAAVTGGQRNLTTLQSTIRLNISNVQSKLESGASVFAATESGLIQNLTNLMTNISSQFTSNVSGINANFDTINTLLNVNASVAKAKLSDMTSQLSNAKALVDSTYTSMVTQARSAASATESKFESDLTSYTDGAKTQVQKSVDDAVSNVTTVFTDPIAKLSKQISDLELNIGRLTDIVVSLKDSPTDLIDRAQALTFAFSTDLQNLKQSIIDLSDDKRVDEFETLINDTMFGTEEPKTKSEKIGIAKLIADLNQRVATVSADSTKTMNDGITSLSRLVSTSAVQQLNTTVVTYKAKIREHVASTKEETTKIAKDAYTRMNQTFDEYYQDLVTKNGTIYSKLTSIGSGNGELEDLEKNVADAEKDVGNFSKSEAMAAMIAKYGSSFATSVEEALNASRDLLTDAEKSAVAQNLINANLALTGANGLGTSTTAFKQVVEEAIISVKSQADQTVDETQQFGAKMQRIDQGAQKMVQLTSADIAAIISKYSAESEATGKAIKDQLAAAGIAEASAADALNIWNSLKESASNYTTDALHDLSETATRVFSEADQLVDATATDTTNDLANLTSTMGKIHTRLASQNDADIALMDDVVTKLQQVESSAQTAKSDYNNQLTGLRGYVTQLASQLAAREQAIVNEASQFKTEIETAAAQDITAVTSKV